MMTPLFQQPVPGRAVRKAGFGFETIMARRDPGRFRRWYDANSRLAALRREDVGAAFGRPDRA